MIPVFEVHTNGQSYRLHHYLEAGRRVVPAKRQPWITAAQVDRLVVALQAAPVVSPQAPPQARAALVRTCSLPGCTCRSMPPDPPRVFEAVVQGERQRGLRA